MASLTPNYFLRFLHNIRSWQVSYSSIFSKSKGRQPWRPPSKFHLRTLFKYTVYPLAFTFLLPRHSRPLAGARPSLRIFVRPVIDKQPCLHLPPDSFERRVQRPRD